MIYEIACWFKDNYRAAILSVYFFCLFGFFECFEIYPIHSYAFRNSHNEVLFSLNIKNMSLEKVCEKIKDSTNYKIIFEPKWKNILITIKLENVTLTYGLKKIMNAVGTKNYALVQNDHEIEIFSFDRITQDVVYSENQFYFDSIQKRFSDYNGISQNIEENQALQNESLKNVKDNSQDYFVTPPTKTGKGLTARELKSLELMNKQNIESRANDTIVTPPSESGEGLTARELKSLLKNY
jgi:type II secretory pathway component GspD/PulD (secretin)